MANRIGTFLRLAAGSLLLISLTVGPPLALVGSAVLAAFPPSGS